MVESLESQFGFKMQNLANQSSFLDKNSLDTVFLMLSYLDFEELVRIVP